MSNRTSMGISAMNKLFTKIADRVAFVAGSSCGRSANSCQMASSSLLAPFSPFPPLLMKAGSKLRKFIIFMMTPPGFRYVSRPASVAIC